MVMYAAHVLACMDCPILIRKGVGGGGGANFTGKSHGFPPYRGEKGSIIVYNPECGLTDNKKLG